MYISFSVVAVIFVHSLLLVHFILVSKNLFKSSSFIFVLYFCAD